MASFFVVIVSVILVSSQVFLSAQSYTYGINPYQQPYQQPYGYGHQYPYQGESDSQGSNIPTYSYPDQGSGYSVEPQTYPVLPQYPYQYGGQMPMYGPISGYHSSYPSSYPSVYPSGYSYAQSYPSFPQSSYSLGYPGVPYSQVPAVPRYIQTPYGNIPVEIIDVDESTVYNRRPLDESSEQNSTEVSSDNLQQSLNPVIQRNSLVKSEPTHQATITRTMDPKTGKVVVQVQTSKPPTGKVSPKSEENTVDNSNAIQVTTSKSFSLFG